MMMIGSEFYRKFILIQVVILQVLVSLMEVITTVIKTMCPISLIKNFELEWALDKDYKKIDIATIDETKIKRRD